MTELKDFYRMLGYHDWYYEYSDDHRVWTKGRDAKDTLERIAKESPEHKKLYEEFAKYIFSGGEKPEQPA